MPTVIPVKFAYVAHDLWFDPVQSGAVSGDHVICTTERGTEIGLATADAKEVEADELARVTSGATLRPVLRVADDEDLEKADRLAHKGDDALPVFRRLVEDSGLDMKPVGIEYLFGGEKTICYFAAEERVDFRQLVRDLSRELHERIDMRQIGVREEAGLAGGYGHCGQELCCARFGSGFDPVSIRMAKEQDLPLNSSKISGACGRLMCCLRYEFEAYRDFKGRAPKKNAIIETPLGKAKIIEYDTPKEQIALRLESGKMIRVPLAGMTCSEAAHKKSEDLGCPCRPDTVTRDVLESLQSADVDMALADLDRANGVAPKETFDESDIFVESKRSRRRGKSSSHSSESDGGSRSEGPAPQEGTRRRRRPKQAGESQSQQQASSGEHASRRRHHHAAGDAAAQGESNRQDQPKTQGQGQKRTRRPGDRGGATRPPASDSGTTSANPEGSTDAPKRKRRHRGGRGHGKGNGTGGAAAGGASSGSSQGTE